jgi:hypothetical protein
MGRVGPRPKTSGIKFIKGRIDFPKDLRREFASVLNLSEDTPDPIFIDQLSQFLVVYPNLVITLDNAPRPAHRKADLRPIRDQFQRTLQDLQNLSDLNFQDLVQGYTESVPIDIDDEAWTVGFEQKERCNDINHAIVGAATNLQSLIKHIDVVIQNHYSKESRGGVPKKARKFLSQLLIDLFNKNYQPVPEEDNPKEAQIEFIQLVFKALNQLNLTQDPLPIRRRAILTLLKQSYPPEPIKVQSNVL